MSDNPYSSPRQYTPSQGFRRSPGPEQSEFSVDCECGASIPVRASDAGGSVTCRCNRVVRVPRLSQLRTAKGLAPHDTNIRDVIARMIAENHLPSGVCCAVTEMPTDDVMWFDVHCESTYTKGTGRSGVAMLILLGIFSWPLALLIRMLGYGVPPDGERLGRDIVVTVPLKVSVESQSKLRRWSTQRYLRKTLGTVPEYRELLREHPNARIYPK